MGCSHETAVQALPVYSPVRRRVAARRPDLGGVQMNWGWRAKAVCVCAALLAAALPATGRTQSSHGDPDEIRLAVMETPAGTLLEDIISGRAQPGFTPVIERGLAVQAMPEKTYWLRLRLDIPADGRARFIRLDRQAIERLRLYQAGPPVVLQAEAGLGQPSPGLPRWPDAFALPIPAQAQGKLALYLELEGQGYLNLQPELLTGDELRSRDRLSSTIHSLLYGAMALIVLLAAIRHRRGDRHALGVALAAFVCLLASVVGNYHLQLTLGGASITENPALPAALWILACAPLLVATQQYAGHDKNFPALGLALDRMGLAVLVLGFAALLVPAGYLGQLQVTALAMLVSVSAVCILAMLFDPRHWRWASIAAWLGLIAALAAMVLSMLQLIPATFLARRGFELMLALQLALYLGLPWFRRLMQSRARRKRVVVPELSAEEKIARARENMLVSLSAALENAAEGDLQWIAYRRLLEGLKPVLAQRAAAVVAMNFHGDDLLLVEPKSADVRYQSLLAQRSGLLKNLSRCHAPQQIGISFADADGPTQKAQLAVIPLPIDKPGWGALLVERNADANYSEGELDFCTELAALATTAGDEAAEMMQARHQAEFDGESGVYKRELIEQTLRLMHETAFLKHTVLSVLGIGIDNYEAIAPEAASDAVRSLVDVIRDEVDYGEVIGRLNSSEFLVLTPGRTIGQACELGERICAQARKRTLAHPSGHALSVSLGVSQAQPGERSPQLMLARVTRALGKARQYGGNQVQAIASTNL